MKTIKMAMAAMMSVMFMGSFTSASAAETEVQTATETMIEVEGETSSSYYVDVDHYDRVEAHSTDVYNKVFYAGESVVVRVTGDHDTDLDLYIYDENDNLIESDTDNTDTCICTFTPRWRGNFKIKIKNLGSVYNRYQLRILQ